MKNDLLPCPFCGGAPELQQDRSLGMADARDRMWRVYCHGCTATSPWIVNTWEKPEDDEPSKRMVRLWWNRRPESHMS